LKVDFFIAGVQKGATTALDAFLRRHPQIQMAESKEPHMFDDESIDWNAPSYSKLHGMYDWTAQDVLRGEATPIYTYWPPAIARLKRYNGAAKLLIGLRHPGFRAFSHWRMEKSRDAETLTFSEAIRVGRDRVAAAPHGVHRVYSYVERGFYSAQIARLNTFDRSQVHYFRTDQLWVEPTQTLHGIQRFLDVECLDLAGREYTVPVPPRDIGAPSIVDLRHLRDLFADDVEQTALATGLNLSDWKEPDYREPMPSPGATGR
jgi:hypothetical protein